jgi:hypothetical protein
MPITREQIEARLTELREGMANALATFNRFNGAVLECEHWIEEFDKSEQERTKLAAV